MVDTAVRDVDDQERLTQLGYRQELRRVLSLFDNFSVAFAYLSPVVGIYSLFVLGAGAGGPAYIWTIPFVVILMLFVALVFGELGSHYPVSGALYQYGKYTVGPGYGWWIGWIYGIALLATVASVDTGVVSYVTTLTHNWFGWHLNPASHSVILWTTVIFIVLQFLLNAVGAKVMSHVARIGVYVETIGTFGVALALGIHGFNHGFGFLFQTAGAQTPSSNALGLNFSGHWLTGAALIAVLASVYIFYGFESAGDIAEETNKASKQIPRSMRLALIYGGIASFVLVMGLLLATPAGAAGWKASITGGIPAILSVLPSWLQDVFLLLVCIAFFSCGTAVQAAGSRVAYAYGRDGALPGGGFLKRVSPRFKTPVVALLVATVVPVLFALLVNVSPTHNKHILWFTYPANLNALFALVSFATSGIYLAFLLTVIGSAIARARGWKPEGAFRLGKWGWPVTIIGGVYLLAMFLNISWPSGITSPRAFFNYDWITLVVMMVIVLVGLIVFLIVRPWKTISAHVHDELEPTGAERHPHEPLP
ncbi:MAG TPA: APC family permease [Acidimicrobiales bacterium]|jgi:amino acid transporter|nr:APC family permease [Acidimicrobiales bacterium]